jgi:hypothetical protein
LPKRFIPCEPKPPTIEGGPFLSSIWDTRWGEEWPTGTVHWDEAEARAHAVLVASEWNNRRIKRWWQFWK